MSRGRRYDDEQKLNLKKVFGLIVIVVLIVFFVVGINNLLKKQTETTNYFSEVAYYPMYQNGKWGVVNSKGEVVIEAEYGEMITVPDNKKAVFICTYEVNYADNTYKTKAIDANNSQLYSSYNSVEVLSNYDSDNNIWNESNVLRVEKDGKYGLINLDGAELVSCTYDKIEPIKGVRNSLIVQKDGLNGLVNNQGNIIIECQYAEIRALTDDYNDGYIVKNSESKYGIISINKEQLLECNYTDIKHICGKDMFIVKEKDKWMITNSAGDKTVEIEYEDVNYINSEIIIAKVNGKYGIFGADKSEKVTAEYQDIEYAYSENYIAKKDDKYGVINSKGEQVVPFDYTLLKYNKEADCICGNKSDDNNSYLIDRNHEVKVIGTDIHVYNGYIRAKVNDEYKFYNLKLEEKSNRDAFENHNLFVAKNDGKYGLVNRDGTLVVQYLYDDVTEQNDYGYVAVKKDGKWGVIDQYGNTVVEPEYEFNDVSDIIFIGKWHSIENVNIPYLISE